jgi:RNase adaptor protein for sRNA GlmZ degradation
VAQGFTYLDDVRLLPKPHITKNIREAPGREL